jgi:glycosyltransferase involved in cell wall biosynthesis
MSSPVSHVPEVRPASARPRLGRHSAVAALIPHHRCEHWLPECVESLVRQTRPLDAIVVIDDASDVPPMDIVRRFPAVTLLRATENVGPYRLIQQVMNETTYDAYLFQDADDWSAADRLEALLREAERTGAEMVGGQEVRVRCMDGEILPFPRPLDANAALAEDPASFPVLHPTSLVSRDLVMRVGGFASGMRFGGDAEFLRRAACVARVVNAPHFGYFRRIRPGSLTMARDTGLRSAARRTLIQALRARALANAEAMKHGYPPDLTPYKTAGPVRLDHLAGPVLKGVAWARPGSARAPMPLTLARLQ